MKPHKASLLALVLFASTLFANGQNDGTYTGNPAFQMKADSFPRNHNDYYKTHDSTDYRYKSVDGCRDHGYETPNGESYENNNPDYYDTHDWNGLIWHDSIWNNNIRYSVTEFRKQVQEGKIKVNQGDEYADTVWFRKQWMPKDKYIKNYYFEKGFVPGLNYQYYKPNVQNLTGAYTGAAFEYLFYAKVHNDDEMGPGQLRFYGKLGYLSGNNSSESLITDLSMGLTMSFEKDPKRTFLVPYFGMEMGSFFMTDHNIAYYMPMAGLQLLALNGIFIGANGGYIYTNTHFEAWRGYFAQANIDISLW